MKKMITLGLSAVLIAATLTGCSSTPAEQTKETTLSGDTTAEARATASVSDFQLKRNVDFYVSSSAGGNSDMFSRTIADIATSKKLTNQPIIITNQVDGQGQIARRSVATSKNPNESLLCLSSGDLTVMITVGGLSLSEFRPIAIMGADKHLIFTQKDGEYDSMEAAIEAAKAGKTIIVGGTSGDERTVYNLLMQELGLEDQFSYIVYGSSSESITALLGGHVQLAMGKPAAAKEYVSAGSISPIIALSTERFTAPFDVAPILSELGYNNVEFPLYRGLVGAGKMTDEALTYWSNVMAEIAQSDEWNEYLTKNLIVPGYLNLEDTTAAYEKVEQDALAAQK